LRRKAFAGRPKDIRDVLEIYKRNLASGLEKAGVPKKSVSVKNVLGEIARQKTVVVPRKLSDAYDYGLKKSVFVSPIKQSYYFGKESYLKTRLLSKSYYANVDELYKTYYSTQKYVPSKPYKIEAGYPKPYVRESFYETYPITKPSAVYDYPKTVSYPSLKTSTYAISKPVKYVPVITGKYFVPPENVPYVTKYPSPPTPPPTTVLGGKNVLLFASRKPKEVQGYNVYVKEEPFKKTKFKKITKKPLPYEKAKQFGFRVADNTIAQTIQLRKTKKKVKPSIVSKIFDLKYKFRKPKKSSKTKAKETYVEKRGYAIDTTGEKQKLKVSQYLARIKRGLAF
jgi:hypothetical protein